MPRKPDRSYARKPWTEAMLTHLRRTGQAGWFTVDSVIKSGMQHVPDDRALHQWDVSYARLPHYPEDWPTARRIEAGARQICRISLLNLERTGVAIIDPPSHGHGWGGRRVKKRIRLAPSSPVNRASPWVKAMYEELADGEWHDFQALIRVMTRVVPPQAAIHNYRINLEAQQKGTRPGRIKAVTLQQKIRDGAWDLCRRAVGSAKQRGRVEIDPPQWQHDIAGKKVRWVGYQRPLVGRDPSS